MTSLRFLKDLGDRGQGSCRSRMGALHVPGVAGGTWKPKTLRTGTGPFCSLNNSQNLDRLFEDLGGGP